MNRRHVLAAALCALLAAPAIASAKDTLAFVTNGSADFWTIASRGTEKAAKELPDYDVDFRILGQATAAEQRRVLDDLLARGVKGVAVSIINPEDATAELNKVAGQAVLFTTDSDAPQSNRAVYIGTDNVAAGRQAGELLKKALPEGGKVMMFVGNTDNANARERIDGIKEVIKDTKIDIVDIRTDDLDFVRAKRNVEDALTSMPDLKGLVGLYSYNTPQIYEAVKAAGKSGQVKVIGFDEDPATLRGVADGTVEATVVQQPFEFGYLSIKHMADYLKGDKSFIPADKKIIVPTRVIDKSNVKDFQKTMQAMLKK